jgi:type I restriction enzyme M protein
MRNDAGVNGDAQRIEQMGWLLFLKMYDYKEEHWELHDRNYRSIIPREYRWRNWAADNKDGKALTGEALMNFVNNRLFPGLKNIEIDESAGKNKTTVRAAFEDNNNYMKDGVLLRQLVNAIDELQFEDYEERHVFGEIYETILRSLQSAGNAGEFYTPRAVTDFMARMIAPVLGEKIADFACGTGGFLISALSLLEPQIKTTAHRKQYVNSVYGVEKKALPYLLCVTNLLLHDIDSPDVLHGNSLEGNVREYGEKEKFDIILMNPPYGGSEKDSIKINFPPELRSGETADLFISLIMYRLKPGGRAALIIPDGFLFGTDKAKTAIKQKLFKEFNVHTIVRMPHSVFSPYTSITTNIIFFDNTGPTKETWVYRLDMPQGYKHFSKTKPMKIEHFEPVINWWKKRKELTVDGFDKAKKYRVQELIDKGYNLDLCGFPREEEEILPPLELIAAYREKRAELNAEIDRILRQIEGNLDA